MLGKCLAQLAGYLLGLKNHIHERNILFKQTFHQILWKNQQLLLVTCCFIFLPYPPQCGKIQYTVEKNGVKKPWWNINSYDIRMLNHQKNKKFPDQILQKSTRGNWPSSKTHRIKKPTPLWKTNFLRCTTLPFNQKLFVNPEGGNKHFVFSQLR